MNQEDSITNFEAGIGLSDHQIDRLNRRFEHAHPDEVLRWAYDTFGSDAVLGTGFGPSGIVLMHRIAELELDIPVFFLDTSLHFDQTYRLRDELEERLGITIHAVRPALSLEEQASRYGDELWKKDPDHCCYLRKVLPLRNYLTDKQAWITGIRRDQARTRKNIRILERDAQNGVVKLNPVAGWSGEQTWEFVRKYNLPYNPLHDEGYPSIGCVPCTSPVQEGEDERNGRWRGGNKIECGIHFSTVTGRFERVNRPER